MKKWYIVDDCTTRRSSIYTEAINAENKEEAEKEARREWESLTKHDQSERDEFSIVLAEQDEDGELDWENILDEVTIKERAR